MKQSLEFTLQLRDKVLKLLKGKASSFFLGGGTALSLFYLHHRESFDLDFFTKDFSVRRIKDIITDIKNSLNVKARVTMERTSEKTARIVRYDISINDKSGLDIPHDKNSFKIDFIEDVYRDIESPDIIINGISILSQENIYLRKIYAACGVGEERDDIGRKRFKGGRQEAKDLFDLYFLSKQFLQLSKFAARYCPAEKEKIITWYHSYNREEMKMGINELIVKKTVEFPKIERHFKQEIENMIKEELP